MSEILLNHLTDLTKKWIEKTPSAFDALRWQALELATKSALPTKNDEAWKYTAIATALENKYQHPVIAEQKLRAFSALDAYQLVFINGFWMKSLSSLPENDQAVEIMELSAAIKQYPEKIKAAIETSDRIKANIFITLNNAALNQGIYLHIKSNATLKKPIHLNYITQTDGEAFMMNPRNIIVVDAHAKATIVESYSGEDSAYFTNAFSQIELKEGAVLHHHKWQCESKKAVHTAWIDVFQQAHSQFHSYSFSQGGKCVRSDTRSLLQEAFAEAHYYGFYRTCEKQHVDHHTAVIHHAPHCKSTELYKGILSDESRAVFNGRVLVEKNAQKTDASQRNQNLLLSPRAEIDTKPELEIYADDVKCAHGATVGSLNTEALFYLRSRGISKDDATALLLTAFAAEVFSSIPNESILKVTMALLAEGLQS